MARIHIAPDHSSWVDMAAKFIFENARDALKLKERFVMALSGGSTPREVYGALPELWKEHGLAWDHVHILWSDERCVPPDHPHSNYRMACEALIDRIDVPDENVHPMYCSDDPTSSASNYENVLRVLYPDGSWPAIDLILLGMGTDGHTASLFPNSPALEPTTRWVVPNHTPKVEHWRLTLTLPVINNAHSTAFLVAGADKASTLKQVIYPEDSKATLPAQLVKTENNTLHWFLDVEAGHRLDNQAS